MTKHLAGEHGPEFVGYGRRPFWANWKGTIAIAAGIAAGAFAVMAIA